MALNDKERTRKVAEAWHYFQKLEDENKQSASTDLIEVNDSEMIDAAAWAESYFRGYFDHASHEASEKFRKRMRENNISYPTNNLPLMLSCSDISSMVFEYADGKRKFGKYFIKHAKKLCRALTQYVEVLEKENK
jgi:hypothetical protein